MKTKKIAMKRWFQLTLSFFDEEKFNRSSSATSVSIISGTLKFLENLFLFLERNIQLFFFYSQKINKKNINKNIK